MRWALEALPYDFRRQYHVKSLDIQYKKDIAMNEAVISSVSVDNQALKTYHSLNNAETGDRLTSLFIEWQ